MNASRTLMSAAATLLLVAGQAANAQWAEPKTTSRGLLTTLQNPGLLQLVTNNAQQQIEVTIGPAAGEVRVSGVDRIPSDMIFTDITTIDLRTGSGTDFVEFRFLSEVIPEVIVNTGAGESDVKFTYEIPFSFSAALASATVIGGTSNDKVNFYVNSSAPSFAASWNVAHGNGNNEVTASVNATNPSELLSINLNSTSGTGQDKLELVAISNADMLNIAVGGTMGSNNDSALVSIDGLAPATSTTSLNLDLGAGADAAEISEINRGGLSSASGRISGGDGIDALVFKSEASGTVNVELNGGTGNDLADMQLKGDITGAPKFLGGTGNDELKLVVDGPRTAAPFFDGGPGFDKAIGFGTFVNIEQIN